jgi:hypothetical protein
LTKSIRQRATRRFQETMLDRLFRLLALASPAPAAGDTRPDQAAAAPSPATAKSRDKASTSQASGTSPAGPRTPVDARGSAGASPAVRTPKVTPPEGSPKIAGRSARRQEPEEVEVVVVRRRATATKT